MRKRKRKIQKENSNAKKSITKTDYFSNLPKPIFDEIITLLPLNTLENNYLPLRTINTAFKNAIDNNMHLLNLDSVQEDLKKPIVTEKDRIDLFASQDREIKYLLKQNKKARGQANRAIVALQCLPESKNPISLYKRHKAINYANKCIIISKINKSAELKVNHAITRFPKELFDKKKTPELKDYWPTLRILNLSHNQLTHLPSLKGLEYLCTLLLQNNKFEYFPKAANSALKICIMNNEIVMLPDEDTGIFDGFLYIDEAGKSITKQQTQKTQRTACISLL